jgi:hypothetical protein
MATAHAAAAKAPAFAIPAMQGMALPQARAESRFMPPLASLAAIPALPAVQRKCGGCAAEERDELPVQPRLEVGPVGDRYEREADHIAGQVMAMREVDAGADEASGAAPAVQRACSSCAASSDPESRARRALDQTGGDEEDETVRARHDGPRGTETIQASDSRLTSGGAPLPAATRGFFESRMDRDLSHVRVHKGGDAGPLNQSIAARAFTYRNHIWLGAEEGSGPSFTMAHELAHVMQQTAPGPVRPRARVMRTYYYEEKGKSLPTTHDEVVNLLTTKDTSLFAEVPVPNANSKGFQITKKRFGRADLARFNGTNVPVGMSTAPCPKDQQDNWYCASNAMRTSSRKPTTLDEATIKKVKQNIIHNGSTWGGQDTQSLPRYGPVPGAVPANGFVRDAGGVERAAKPSQPSPSGVVPAPVKSLIELADVKAGAFPSARQKAVRQLRNYMFGFQEVSGHYRDIRLGVEERRKEMKAAGKNDLSSLPDALTPWEVKADLIDSIKGVGQVQKIHATSKDIILKKWTSDLEGGIARSEPVPNAVAVPGNLYLWRDTGLAKGAWSYLWAPDDSEAAKLYAALGPDPDYDTLNKNSRCLREALLIPATAPKAGSAAATKLAASPAPGCLKPLRASQAPQRVRRAPPKKKPAKPKPPPDPFQAHFENWKAKQTGLTKGFETYGKSQKGGERRGAMAELEARQNIAGTVPGKEAALSKKGAETLKEQGSELFWLETLGGRSGALIGQLRKRFGGLFEKLVNAYATMREKVEAFLARLAPKKPGKGIGRAVLTIIAKLLGAVGRWVLPQVYQALQDCLEEGVSKKIDDMFSDGPLAVIREKVDAAIAFANELTEGVLNAIGGVGDKLATTLGTTVDEIKEATDFIEQIIAIGKGVFDAVRLAICAAGGIESFGLACAVTLIDKVLSFFDASPLEALGESLLSTCMGQTLLAEALMAFEAVRKLPSTIAATIVDFIKPILPEAARGILCDTAGMKLELPKVRDVTCGSGGSPGATPGPGADGKYTKGDWSPPSRYTPGAREKTEDRASTYLEGGGDPGPPPPKPKPDPKPKGGDAPDKPAAPPSTPAQQPAPEPQAQDGPGKAPATVAPGTGAPATEAADSVGEGHLDGKPMTINIELRGGFDPKKSYDGKTAYTVDLIATDSDNVHYGPVPIEVYVYAIVKADPGWRISFKFKLAKDANNIVLTDGVTGNSFEIHDSATKVRSGKLRGVKSTRHAAPPMEGKKK